MVIFCQKSSNHVIWGWKEASVTIKTPVVYASYYYYYYLYIDKILIIFVRM